jgi:hypothetical protein
LTGLNYWCEELWWRRPAGPITAARNLGTPLFVGLLSEITQRTCEVVVESCDTMEELREYRALFMPCWQTRLMMEDALASRYGIEMVKGW